MLPRFIVIVCQRCGVECPARSTRRRFCDKCAIDHNREYNREYKREMVKGLRHKKSGKSRDGYEYIFLAYQMMEEDKHSYVAIDRHLKELGFYE